MAKQQGSEGQGTSKPIESSSKQDQIRRAAKTGRNHQTKGTVRVEVFLDRNLKPGDVGYAARQRKIAHDKAKRDEFRKQRETAILKERKKEYARKGEALLAIRTQMNEAEDDAARLTASLATAPVKRHGEIKAALRKVESKLRGMQARVDSLEARIKELDGMIFGGQPLTTVH